MRATRIGIPPAAAIFSAAARPMPLDAPVITTVLPLTAPSKLWSLKRSGSSFLIYFGVMRSYFVLGATMMIVLVALLIWTSPGIAGVQVSRCITCRECIGPNPGI